MRYIFVNLDFFRIIKQKFKFHNVFGSKSENYSNKTQNDIINAVDYIFRTLAIENSDRKLIFLIDALRPEIYSGEKSISSSKKKWQQNALINIAEKYQIDHLDLTDLFYRDYLEHHKKFEFDNDNHWNTYGHRRAAEGLNKYLISIGAIE